MMMRNTFKAVGGSVARGNFAATSVRTMLDFQPIDEKYLSDPLDETAWSALAKSCYCNINWRITESATVQECVTRLSANKIGALAVTKSGTSDVVGIISERDYLTKIGVLGLDPTTTKVGEVCTYGRSNLVTVTIDNPIEKCMDKMLNANTRHLFVREKGSDQLTGKIVGMISIKDVVKCNLAKEEALVGKLTGMAANTASMKYDT